jgi:RecG-like helicase
MKFPITRESLQAFDYAREQEEIKEEEIQKMVTLLLDQLCKEFKQQMPSNTREKRFVWRSIHNVRQLHIPGFQPQRTDDYLPRFIDKLKERFIGCDIIIDPLKTYLIIDWS